MKKERNIKCPKVASPHQAGSLNVKNLLDCVQLCVFLCDAAVFGMFLSVFDTRDSSQSRVRLSVSDIDRLKSAHRRLSVPSCVNISWLSSQVISAATRMGGARLLYTHVLKICQTLQINSYLGKQARLSRISGVSVDSSADLLQFFEVFTSVSVGVVGFFLPSFVASKSWHMFTEES